MVARKPGIVTADGTGAGIAQATIGADFGALIRTSNQGKIGVFMTRKEAFILAEEKPITIRKTRGGDATAARAAEMGPKPIMVGMPTLNQLKARS